ncbi:MAG: thymidine phosphorylase family protein [Bacteroidia bacterium]
MTVINSTGKSASFLQLKRLGIDSYQENIVFIRHESEVYKSEGFKALTRVVVTFNNTSIVATLNVVQTNLFALHEASLSEIAFERLNAKEGDSIHIRHLEPLSSLQFVRAKIYGKQLGEEAFIAIIYDICRGKYSDVQLAAFIAACSGKNRMTLAEITSLTKAMISSGDIISWNGIKTIDKHSIGGLPGNRTTPIVVSIAAAAGLCIPKTSSRSITSPAGTADVMEVMTNVELSIDEIKAVVNKEGGCLAWGGAVNLSPADDILIKVERALDIDSEAQLVASVLSKKAAAGSSQVIIEIPVGITAKVRSYEKGEFLKNTIEEVALNIGLGVKVILTDGSQPIGRGIGPALEATDVLAVLRNADSAPQDLRQRSLVLAGNLLEMGGVAAPNEGYKAAENILTSGKALEKLYAICHAQGGFKEPVIAQFSNNYLSAAMGTVVTLNNRKLSLAAKLAGAPQDKGAGILLLKHLGDKVEIGTPLFTVFTESEGTLQYVFEYLEKHPDIIQIENSKV